MENKEVQKKGSALDIDDAFDFKFAKKWPVALRWALAIPIGILGLLLVQLAYGFIVNMFLKNFSETSIIATIVNAGFGLLKIYLFMIAMVAMAPVATVNKFKAGLGFSLVPYLMSVGIVHLGMRAAAKYPEVIYSSFDIAIQIGVTVLAVILSLWYIKSETNKKKSDEGVITP